MRMSQLLVRTLREAPADAEVASHQLLVRAGYIRRLASGIYTFLPLGLRVLHRVETVIREELDAAGCQELLLPALHPIELWEQSGRAAMFGSDALPAMTVEARGGTFVLGPTHEEVVTVTVGAEVDSYRQLPVTVYQIQVKFRDEARPRFGLMRTRELIMADAYSFDVDKDAMQGSYRAVLDAYLRIFGRLGLEAIRVGRDRRRRQPRVHGALGGGRGPLRLLWLLRVRRQRRGSHPGGRPGGGRG
jgi:prolyl-tRNA synthetase